MPADSKEWLPKRPRLVKQSNISFKVFKSNQYSQNVNMNNGVKKFRPFSLSISIRYIGFRINKR